MSQVSKLMNFVIRAIIAGLALAFVLVYLWPTLAKRLAGEDTPAPAPAIQAPVSYADAVNHAAPTVVSIRTRYIRPATLNSEAQQITGIQRLYQMEMDQGSGVLMSEDGYILTNHHVIEQASAIRVALWDGRDGPARVVGSDPATDLAVLKIEFDGLPMAKVAENPEVRVGDVVLAIGNALGLTHTVTMGIVSATGRNNLDSSMFEDFIQTDAAINSGNSGGALVNAAGELIGINTRGLNVAVGGQNIGFAIPIKLAQHVMTQIIDYGTVRRGWIGAIFADLRAFTRSDGTSSPHGVGVRSVAEDGPAWKAGIREGDVIMAFNGEPVIDAKQLLLAISQREPGSQAELVVVRGAEQFETYATLIQQPPLQ